MEILKIGIFLFLSILLRATIELEKHKKKKGENYSALKYFDLKHSVRWVSHIIASILAAWVLPDALEYLKEYVEFAPNLHSAGVILVGYLGIDLIKFAEILSLKFATKIGLDKANKTTIIILIISITSLQSCTYEYYQKKYGGIARVDSIIIKDTITKLINIEVPPDSAGLSFHIDSLLKLKYSDTIYSYSSDSLIELKQYVDSITKELKTRAKWKGKTIIKEVKVPIYITAKCPPCIEIEKPKESRPNWFYWLLMILIFLLIILILKK